MSKPIDWAAIAWCRKTNTPLDPKTVDAVVDWALVRALDEAAPCGTRHRMVFDRNGDGLLVCVRCGREQCR